MVKKIILRQKNNETLLRIERTMQLGKKNINTIRYEWWSNIEKMGKDIRSEFIDGQQYIYCRGYAGANENELIKQFDSQSV